MVLGLKLRNYAIGHELALIRQSNPIVTYTEQGFDELSVIAKSVSLANAVELCCYRKPLFKLLWGWKASKMDLLAEVAKFRRYRMSGNATMPIINQPRTKGVPFHYFGAPELARLVNYVSEHHQLLIAAHFDNSPLNFPLGLAQMLYMTYLESEGAIWVENFQDVDLRERKAKYDKAHPEAGIAVGDAAVKEARRKWNAAHPDVKVPED